MCNDHMEYVSFGQTGIKVSRLCLGTAFRATLFKKDSDEPAAIRTIQHALDSGINFIDTANFYSYGRSERLVGRALAGRRHHVIIASKFASPVRENPGPNDQGASRYHILREIDNTLKRLNTDFLDIYWLHTPDPSTPIEETLGALDDLIKAGKVRAIGCSNLKAWQVCEALWQSDKLNLHAFAAVQNQYSLLNRWELEPDLLPICRRFGLATVTYSPLAMGLLSGAFRRGRPAIPGTPWADVPQYAALFDRMMTPRADEIVSALIDLAGTHRCTPAQVAIGFILAQHWITSLIIGPDTPEQTDEVLAATAVKLSAHDLALLSSLSAPDQPLKVA